MRTSKNRHCSVLDIYLLLIINFLIFTSANAQFLQVESLEENVLKVNGSSSIEVIYDIAVISIELQVVSDSQLITYCRIRSQRLIFKICPDSH